MPQSSVTDVRAPLSATDCSLSELSSPRAADAWSRARLSMPGRSRPRMGVMRLHRGASQPRSCTKRTGFRNTHSVWARKMSTSLTARTNGRWPSGVTKMRRQSGSALIGLALVAGLFYPARPAGAEPKPDADGYVDLFGGKTLDGWTQRGGKAKYAVTDGQIVGTAVPNTPNSFLCTQRDYGDFILELEFKVDPTLNSGVQVRSHFADE